MQAAVIGVGYWGPNLVRNVYETRLCDRIVCCDPDEKKLERIQMRYPAIVTEKDCASVLADPRMDAVLIATPVSTHFAIGRDALLHNKHVFI